MFYVNLDFRTILSERPNIGYDTFVGCEILGIRRNFSKDEKS